MKTVSVIFDPILYEQLVSHSRDQELTVSQAIRLAVKKYYKLGEPINSDTKPAAEPPKKVVDSNKVGVDGYTHAEREAILAKAKARAESGEPWEPPKPVPLPNIVRPTVKRDILSEWEGD